MSKGRELLCKPIPAALKGIGMQIMTERMLESVHASAAFVLNANYLPEYVLRAPNLHFYDNLNVFPNHGGL